MDNQKNKREFIQNIRKILSETRKPHESVSEQYKSIVNKNPIEERVQELKNFLNKNIQSLETELLNNAKSSGWQTKKLSNITECSNYINNIIINEKAKSVVTSNHKFILDLHLNDENVKINAIDKKTNSKDKNNLRNLIINADIGISNVDYAIADTGTCVLISKRELSRLVSLLPPIYIAIVNKKQILANLENLFTLQKHKYLQEDLTSSISLISGPSRSADIQSELITGVHGPGKVHMILID